MTSQTQIVCDINAKKALEASKKVDNPIHRKIKAAKANISLFTLKVEQAKVELLELLYELEYGHK